MEIKHFFDPDTNTLSYIVSDPSTQQAAIIDPVLDYDPKASKITRQSVRTMISYLQERKLNPVYVLETHAHADHLSGSQVFKEYFPDVKVAINERIVVVQDLFKSVFNFERDFPSDGSQFDQLLKIGASYEIGNLKFKVLSTPGHTPACTSLFFEGKVVFTGDALFMPDYGTGRCDFPGGSAEDLYDSIVGQLYSLPDSTKVFTGHDYMPNGRELRFESTIGEEKLQNIRLTSNTSKEQFVAYRKERDQQLDAPRLLLQSVQFNIRAGKWPPPETNGVSYFKMPLTMG